MNRSSGILRRTVRNMPNNSFQILPADMNYVTNSVEEESGEAVNEPLSDSDDGLNDYCSQSSNDDEGLHDYCLPSDEEEENEYSYEDDFESSSDEDENGGRKVIVDIGNEITVTASEELQEELSDFTTIKWDVFDRNVKLFKALSNTDVRFASDIYKIFLQSPSPIRSGYQQRSVGQGENSQQCQFCFDCGRRRNIIFKVPVLRDQLTASDSVVRDLFIFSAYIETGGKWEEVDATYDAGYVKFPCTRVNSFCIISRPKENQHVVCPTGTRFVTGSDGRLIVHFPEGSVNSRKQISYSVKQPEIIYICAAEDRWKPKILVAVSDRISLGKKTASREKPVYFSFPVPKVTFKNKRHHVRLIGFKGTRPYVLNTKPQQIGDDVFYEVKGYNGAALALVQRPADMQQSYNVAETLKLEIDIFYGDRKVCNLLLLLQNKGHEYIQFIAECVFNHQLQETIDNYTKNGYRVIDQSEPLFLFPLQRIRLRISGCIQLVPGKGGSHYFLTFVHASKDNSIVFPVKIQQNAGGTPYAIIDFEADNIHRGVLHSVHFELHELSRTNMYYTPHPRRKTPCYVDSSLGRSLNQLNDTDCTRRVFRPRTSFNGSSDSSTSTHMAPSRYRLQRTQYFSDVGTVSDHGYMADAHSVVRRAWQRDANRH